MSCIKRVVYDCDFTGRRYPEGVEGAAFVAQGNTGRWCVVMTAGPEYLKENKLEPVEASVLRREIEENGDGWCDF